MTDSKDWTGNKASVYKTLAASNHSSSKGFYVAVLNWYMCPECFNKWIKRAVHYTEDYRFEKEMFSKTKKRLSKLGMWNNEIDN